MDFTKINLVVEWKQLPLVKLTDLVLNYSYTITGAYKANTKYGVSFVLQLTDTKSVFVNKRLAKYFIDNPMEFENLRHHIKKGSPTLQYLGGTYNSIRIQPDSNVMVEDEEVNFENINTVAELKELPLLKLSHLQPDSLYPITAAFKVNTKHGVGLVLHLTNSHSVFVNSRLAKYFDESPKEFSSFQNHIEKGVPSLEYMGGNSARLHPDVTVEDEEVNFGKINAELKELPVVKLTDLHLNDMYDITATFKTNTRYGVGFVLHLANTHGAFANRRKAKYFSNFQNHVEKGVLSLEYMGGHSARVFSDPDGTVENENGNFNKINDELKELPLVKLSDLHWDYLYTITAAYKVKTKYGVTVMMHLDNTYSVFLNKRRGKMFEEYPHDFEDLLTEIGRSSPRLEYVGGKYNAIRLHPGAELTS